ncbi:hypothetical protein [Allobranchiibius sp. CTAmp26]|uniref:hypothetical protein n=1 Tax=Allobranchiibius sp. CTAmp26 TaxID=2815214 RepID=UPI001AA1D02A|nr:hypothetical protein [Allobranchiibius sp. CTAmp26]MBO1756552.1 hypothetical protein [Allobranchiibius sp. CTAmp26]
MVGRLVALPPVTTDPPISEQARTNSVRAAVGAVLGIELLFLAYTALGATHGLHTPYPESDLSSGWVAAGWAVHVLNWGAVALMVASVVTACALGRWRRPAAMQLTINSAHPARP